MVKKSFAIMAVQATATDVINGGFSAKELAIISSDTILRSAWKKARKIALDRFSGNDVREIIVIDPYVLLENHFNGIAKLQIVDIEE